MSNTQTPWQERSPTAEEDEVASILDDPERLAMGKWQDRISMIVSELTEVRTDLAFARGLLVKVRVYSRNLPWALRADIDALLGEPPP